MIHYKQLDLIQSAYQNKKIFKSQVQFEQVVVLCGFFFSSRQQVCMNKRDIFCF